jgi:prepilin-type N-terminal cleavage/methylation domain-containing protein
LELFNKGVIKVTKIRAKLIRKEEAFTFIELLVVIAVLSILVAVAIPQIGSITKKAKLTEAQSAIGSIKTALELIYSEKESYLSADTGGSYKNSADLLADTDIDQYLDNISDNWKYNIVADADDYFIEVIGNGGSYPNSLKASITKGDDSIITTTKNTSP